MVSRARGTATVGRGTRLMASPARRRVPCAARPPPSAFSQHQRPAGAGVRQALGRRWSTNRWVYIHRVPQPPAREVHHGRRVQGRGHAGIEAECRQTNAPG
jgi:hypothetical protein